MEITVLFYGLLVSFLVIFSGRFSYSDAKTVSLNELIAAESRARLFKHDSKNRLVEKSRSKDLLVVEESRSKDPLVAEVSRSKNPLIAEESRSKDPLVAEESRSKDPLVAEESRSKDPLVAEESRSKDPLIAEESRTSLATSYADRGVKNEATDTVDRRKGYKLKPAEFPTNRLLSNKYSTKTSNKLKRKNPDSDTGASTVKELLAKNRRKKYAEKSKSKLRAKNSDKSTEAERFSLNKFLFRDTKNPREFEIAELITSRGKKLLSSLKYKKKFQIQSPLKPKKLSYLQKPRQKLKSQSVKRQAYNERFNKEYVPLLKSLSMLFDNVLYPGSREGNEDGDEGIDDLVPDASRVEVKRIRNSNNETYREFIKSRQTKNAKLREHIRNYLRNKSSEGSQSNEITGSKKERTSGKTKNNNSFKYKTNSTSSEDVKSYESEENRHKSKLKEVKETNNDNNEKQTNICSCSTKANVAPTPSKAEEAINTKTVVTEVSVEQAVQTEATSTTTDITSPSNIIHFGQDQNVSAVPSGNSSGLGRNVSGLSEGSSAPLHGSTEGNISRNHGDSKYHPGSGENKPNATDDDKLTHSYTRERANGRQPRGPQFQDTEAKSPVYRGNFYKSQEIQTDEETFPVSQGSSRHRGSIIRNMAVDPIYRGDTIKLEETQIIEEDFNGTRGSITEFERDDIIEIGKDTEQSASTLSESFRRLGGHVGEDSVSVRTKPLRFQEDDEKGVNSVARSVPSDKRFLEGGGSSTAEIKEAGSADEAIITVEDLADPIKMLKPGPKGKTPYVTIIDGYSVARNINGKNKWKEQSIRYHS